MVEWWWMELPNKFPTLELDEYIVMRNHIHGILVIVWADLCVRPDISVDQKKGAHTCLLYTSDAADE